MDFRVRVCCVREMYVRWDILGENVWRVGDTSSHFSYSIADAFRVVCAGVHTTVAAGGCVDVGIAATDRWWACATLAATEAYRTGLDEIVGSAGLGGGAGYRTYASSSLVTSNPSHNRRGTLLPLPNLYTLGRRRLSEGHRWRRGRSCFDRARGRSNSFRTSLFHVQERFV